jgi:hypothetical protein
MSLLFTHRPRTRAHHAPLTILFGGLLATVALPLISTTDAWSQVSTGGVVGTTATGTLGAGDFFLGVQKVEGVNLTPADQALFLNRASCECQRTAWLRALLYPAAAAKAVTIPSTATVSMYLGNNCNDRFSILSCLPLKSVPFSEFKLNGMQVQTSVDVLAKLYSAGVNPGSGGDSGSGGLSGSGGVSGSGGASGSGGVSGSGGASGSGGVSGSTSTCSGMITQTVWLLVETSIGLFDIASASLPLIVDGDPLPAPTNVVVNPANEALIVNWTAVDQTVTSDLTGYQLFCTRGDQLQVFNDGSFSTSIDSCLMGASNVSDYSPTAITDRNTHFLCSDLLSTSTTSFRVKVLQNDIPYVVGVAAVDLHGNASLITPAAPVSPKLTFDFYHAYRAGEPQGQATGGYCAVAEGPSGRDIGGGAAAACGLGLIAWNRRRAARRSRP